MPPLMDLFANRPLKGPDDSLGFLLWRVTHAWQRFVDDRLQVCGLTHLQFALMIALGWLTRHDEPTTQSALIAFVDMHPMQVSQVLSTLERKGQISPGPMPGERTHQTGRTHGVRRSCAPSGPALSRGGACDVLRLKRCCR